MGLYFEGHHGKLLGPDGEAKQVKIDAYREMANGSNSDGKVLDSSVEGTEAEVQAKGNGPINDGEWKTETLIEPTKESEDVDKSLAFIDPTTVEKNVKASKNIKITLLSLGIAAVTLLIFISNKQIKLNHHLLETVADYEAQLKVSKEERDLYASRYDEINKEANEVISQVNAGTYGSTPESQIAGENIYFFSNKIALKNMNLEDISRPQLNMYFRVSSSELENKMGFTLGTTVSQDEYGRNYVKCTAPLVETMSGVEGGKYYLESKTLEVNIPNALFTKEDGTYKAVTSNLPFVDVATDNGINFNVTLTEYSSLAEYCEKEGLLPSPVEGAPLDGQPTSTKNYLTADNVEAIATRAYQDPGFEVMYTSSGAGNPYAQTYYSNDFFIAESSVMKYATAYFERGKSMAFYQVGGVPYAK